MSSSLASEPAGLPAWASHPLLDGLTPELTSALAATIQPIHVKVGEVVIRAGEPNTALFIVGEGRLRASGLTPMPDLVAGDSIGAVEMLSLQPNPTTLTAVEDSVLYELSREAFIKLSHKYPALVLSITEEILPGLQHTQVADILVGLNAMNVPFPNHALYSRQLTEVLQLVFGQMEPAIINQLQNELEWLTLETGEVLFRQGEAGDDMVIIVNGRLRVTYRDGLEVERVIGEVTTGDTVGEFALLTDEPRSATVVAVRESHVVRLTREVFYRLIDNHPKAMFNITQSIVRRQQRTQTGVTQRKRTALTVAIIPIHREPPAEFVRGVLRELQTHGSAMVLDVDKFEAEFGMTGAADTDIDEPMGAVIAGWLSKLENDFDILLYIASPKWTPWTRRCLRQADRVYLFGFADEVPGLSPVEKAIYEQSPNLQPELVLLHSPRINQPSGTSAWLAQRKIRNHHHIRLGDLRHYGRLARRMTGKSLGLVLSGGAARGFAHIGVLKALEELGIPLDMMGGTSIGALIAAAYDLRPNADEMIKMAGKFSSSRTLFDYTLPFLSVMTSRKITNVLKEIFEDTLIEDLWTPFFAVSSNMSRAVPMMLTKGSIRRAIRATTAIPGVFTPVLVENEVLVDGGLLDNFPINPAREYMDGGRLIGILASPLNDNVPFFDVPEEYVSGWRVLFNRFKPASKRQQMPSMPGLIMRSAELSNVLRIRTALQASKDDLVLQLETNRFGILEFGAYQQLIALGHELSKSKIEAWLKNNPS